MKRIISVIIGLIGVFVGVGIFLPALAHLKAQGALPHVTLLALGVIVVLGGVGAACYGARKRAAK